MAETVRYEGAIDADGHVLEPETLWQDYLEAKYRDRAITVETGPDGVEYLAVDGQVTDKSVFILGAMGNKEATPQTSRYTRDMLFGAGDASERVAWLDQEHLAGSVLYGSLALLWETAVTDVELTLAYQRAYNRWMADFCRDSGGRLVPIAHLTLLDPEASARELERAVEDGCRGGFVAPFTHTRTPHGDPVHDALWAKAVELDVPITIHTMAEPRWSLMQRFDSLGAAKFFQGNTFNRHGSEQALLSFISMGALDRFPTLKLGILEVGAGWIGGLLDRADSVWLSYPKARLVESSTGQEMTLSALPSEIFRRQCFISADPDESTVPVVMDHVGSQCFVWASDYPHNDHTAQWADALNHQAELLSEASRQAYLGDNVRRLYGMSV